MNVLYIMLAVIEALVIGGLIVSFILSFLDERKKKQEPAIGPSEPSTSTCKRCGMVYEPRLHSNMLGARWGITLESHDIQCAPFWNDKALLIASVNPQDYCPRCEEHLLGVHKYLLGCLKKRPIGEGGSQ